MSFYDSASLVFLPSGGAGKDGKAYSIKPVPEYGNELITNGGFDTDSDWTKGTGWTISGGTANCDGTQTATSQLKTSAGLSIQNTLVEFSFEVKNYSAGTLIATIEGTGGNEFSGINSNGVYTIQATSSDSTPRIAFNANSSFIGSIDNVSVKEVIVDGDFTFSRGSNLTATRVDSNGLIEKGRENTQLYTNNLSNLSGNQYGSNQVTISTSQADPFGNSEAILLTPTEINSYHRWYKLNATLVGVQTISLYAKPNGYTNIYAFSNESNQNVTYSLIGSGSVITSSGNTIDSKIEQLSGGWYRISHTVNCSSTNWWGIYIGTGTSAYVGDGTSGVYFYGFQVEQGLVATEYIESGATTGLAGILEDSPRFDYSGGASCPSLLLEPQRSNIVGFTEYLEGTNWGVGGSTGLQLRTSIASPDGNNGVYLVTSEAENTSSRVQYNLGTLGNDHIFSVFIKGTGSATRIRLRNNTASVDAVEYDIDSSGNFTLNTQSAHDGYYGVDDYGNGWHRVYLKVETNSGANNFMQIYTDVVDADGSIYVWGAQAEEASYISSYMPNHSGGSVTRSADNPAQLDVTNFTSTYNTFFAEFEVSSITNQGKITLSDNSQNNRMTIYQTTDDLMLLLNVGGSSQTSITASNVLSVGTNFKVIAKHQNGSHALFINGTKIGEQTSTTPTGLNKLRYGNEIDTNDSQKFLGNIKQTLVFPTALSDTDCEILTGTSYESFAAMATALNYTTYE